MVSFPKNFLRNCLSKRIKIKPCQNQNKNFGSGNLFERRFADLLKTSKFGENSGLND
ncbi:hypothetical protein LEP1GSC125_1818 [Leptospira mayottensis 200901122]|uniref:Uncharacterized protein n=1 Tax=Leptospira mayottensis 200901122 TaxID=1193010 RepID=A0AA87MK04_9LEPT|nr:hypothetical protein LEP1GSC125_1818 [Leptospira mayottensis 200901122]